MVIRAALWAGMMLAKTERRITTPSQTRVPSGVKLMAIAEPIIASPTSLYFDLIRLHLLQILRTVLNLMLMDSLTMVACTFIPIAHRALIQLKGFHNRLHRTTIRQQNNHPHHNLRVGAQPVKDRPLAGCKGLSTDCAAISFVFPAVNMNVPFASLTPCGAVPIRAKYLSWVHWWLSWMSKSFEFASEPCFLQVFPLPHHG